MNVEHTPAVMPQLVQSPEKPPLVQNEDVGVDLVSAGLRVGCVSVLFGSVRCGGLLHQEQESLWLRR